MKVQGGRKKAALIYLRKQGRRKKSAGNSPQRETRERPEGEPEIEIIEVVEFPRKRQP
ncbi:MAG: hypothetical protein JO083_05675 [Candidatus Eremiobacteraeota bacterium]|nr:hypothetical protein [Candidatus Eremiobacteraeota bacterium]